MEIFEIIVRVICALLCLGVLISASIALSAINEVEDSLNAAGLEYEDVGSYRGAAGWLVSVASGAILFHIVSIIIRILYLSSYIEKHHGIYGAVNAILTLLFALSMFSGGIVNLIYASDNSSLHGDLCSFHNSDLEFCSGLERVEATETASGVMSTMSMMLYLGLCCSVICGAAQKACPAHETGFTMSPQRRFATSHRPTRSRTPVNTSQSIPPPEPVYPPTNPSQHVSPSAPYPPVPVSSYVSPSAPVECPATAPSYTSAEPPPYELAVTLQYKSQHVPSGDPPNEFTTGIAP